MILKLIVPLLLSSQTTFSLRLSQHAKLRTSQADTNVLYHTNPYDNCSEPLSIPTTSTTTSKIAVLTSWSTASSVLYMNSSGTGSRSHLSNVTTDLQPATPASATVRETSTYSTRVPGKNGIPGCSYVVAADIGLGAACSEDYCNCDGTVGPLLSSQESVGGMWTSNCAYTAQPTTDSCPEPTTPPTNLVLETVYVDPVCTATVGGGETCGVNTVTSITTIRL